jgi:NIPSNAP
MLFDIRTYRVRPGALTAQLEVYAQEGYAVQCRYLGAPIFYGTVETGDVNAYVHLWRFRDAADRERKRTALYTDQAWLQYRQRSAEAGYQTEQTNTLLRPAPFWRPGALQDESAGGPAASARPTEG